MVSALISISSGPGSSPGRGHCVVFLCNTHFPTVPHSTHVCKCVPANLMLGVNPSIDWLPIRWGVEILLVASCYRNWGKLRPDEPIRSYVDLTLPYRVKPQIFHHFRKTFKTFSYHPKSLFIISKHFLSAVVRKRRENICRKRCKVLLSYPKHILFQTHFAESVYQISLKDIK